MKLLDVKCAEYGDKIASISNEKSHETLITKSLGVLQEDGLYAFFLYLLARGKKEGLKTAREVFKLLKEIDKDEPTKEEKEQSPEELLTAIREIANNLDQLLLAKEILERTLVYARYHAKARSSSDSGEKAGGEE